MLLHNLGVDFEDKQYIWGETTGEKSWPDDKEKLGIQFANLPYWQDGDVCHAETPAVIRSICRKYCPDYLGRNPNEQAYAEIKCGKIEETFFNWFVPYMIKNDYASKREEGTQKGREFCELIQDCLGDTKFIAGNDITYADFSACRAIKTLALFDKSMVEAYPKLG